MKKFFQRNTWRGSERSVVTLVALVALCFGLITSVFLSTRLRDQNKIEHRETTTQRLSAISSQISDKVSAYEQMLLSGSALMQLKPDTTREEWQQFANGMRLTERFPSTLGFGYVEFFDKSNLSAHEDKIRASGLEDYRVHPSLVEQNRQMVSAITYLEPVNELNKKALGFDMFSEETRRAAMQKAIDTASVTISQPVSLVQLEDTDQPTRGALLYYPIYSSAKIPSDIATRRQSVRGFAYIVFLPNDILGKIAIENVMPGQELLLSDISGQVTMTLASNITGDPKQPDTITQNIRIADRVWRASLSSAPSTRIQRWLPLSVLLGGMFISFLSAFALFRLLNKRLQILNKVYDQKIQDTKEDMLALASHQLRTPASGVKQYIGMLTQGFVGELNEHQLSIAEKAYAANERQLEIINQMLYVAKADAGQIMLEPTKINLLELAKTSLSIQKNTAERKKVHLTLDSTRAVNAYGDPRYVAMIIDNLISNAIKYTQSGKSVVLRVYRAENMACLSVSDEGVGIPKKDISRVFEKFARIENPLTHSEGGNGLGLYLAYGLARAQGGTLEVASEVNVGSTFILCLPQKMPRKDKIRVRLDQLEKELPQKHERKV